ncbi:MAG: HEAT repeat domain-containing protein [Promethearchaeota archaeon]
MYPIEVSPILKYSRYILCIGFVILFTAVLFPPYFLFIMIAGGAMTVVGCIAQFYLHRLIKRYEYKTSLGIDFLFPEIDSWLVSVDFIAMPEEPIVTETEFAEAEIADLIRIMQTKKRKRNDAAQQLASGGSKVVPYVSQLFTESDADIRAKAAAILRHLGPRAVEAIPTLTSYIDDPEPVVQGQVICALARIGTPAIEAIPPLVNQLNSESEDIRICSALATGRILGKKEAKNKTLKALKKLLDDSSSSVQTAALLTLEDLGEEVEDAIELLISGLRDLNPILALQCAQHLSYHGKSANEAIPDLIEALKSNHPIISIICSHALYRMEYDPLALLRPILTAAKNGDLYVKMEALEILEDMGPAGEPAMQAYVRMLGDKNTLVRVMAVRGISFLGEKARPLAPQLRRALDDPAKAVRHHAETILKALGEPLEEPKLINEENISDSS